MNYLGDHKSGSARNGWPVVMRIWTILTPVLIHGEANPH